jgi:hypothetical protein
LEQPASAKTSGMTAAARIRGVVLIGESFVSRWCFGSSSAEALVVDAPVAPSGLHPSRGTEAKWLACS